MNEIKIPKEFQLFGQTIKVKFNNKKCGDREAYGSLTFVENKILLATEFDGEKIQKDRQERTFFHELCHAILDNMNEHDLSKDEKFVHNFASLLHQALKTSIYE